MSITTRECGPDLTDWIIQRSRHGYHCEQHATDSGIVIRDYDLDSLLAKLCQIINPGERVYEVDLWIDGTGADFIPVGLAAR